jgi:hypothetical protein
MLVGKSGGFDGYIMAWVWVYGYGLEFAFLYFTGCTLFDQRWGAESDQLINESMILP